MPRAAARPDPGVRALAPNQKRVGRPSPLYLPLADHWLASGPIRCEGPHTPSITTRGSIYLDIWHLVTTPYFYCPSFLLPLRNS